MGLDMYLYKTKRVEGLTAEDYQNIDEFISNKVESENDLLNLNLEKETGILNANELLESIGVCGEHFHWYSLFEKIGYWRKANQIHSWIVDNVQNGIDECQLSIFPKSKLEELLQLTNEVSANKEKAQILLPTQSGFFFGNTEYDEWYDEDIQLTINILSEALSNTDFEKEVIFYRSSW